MSEQTVETPYDASAFVPRTTSWKKLAEASLRCEGCPLFVDTTQTVFGKGPTKAAMILIGEQPGDVEDRRGTPFVGPAGAMLWRCIEEAGIERTQVYATNAVKHFKHEQRGKRRLHKKPGTAEIEACHPWLDAELRVVTAPVLVALGAVAARSLLGRTVAIGATRSQPIRLAQRTLVVTYHPSAVLRADDRAAEVRAALVEDLRRAKALADGHA
jgi:DNA polymerase